MMSAQKIILNFAVSAGGPFRKQDLLSHLQGTSFSLPYINLTLNRMVNASSLTRIARGLYQLADTKNKKEFCPKFGQVSMEIASFLKENLPYTRYCLYEGEWINPFMHHVAGNRLHYLEVQREATDSVFERLMALGHTAYLRPDKEFMYRYVDIHNDSAIIIKPLISESPLLYNEGIPCPTLEKILVDIFKDPDFSYLHGAEYLNVLRNVKRVYRLNERRLLRYASRRSLKEEITNALNETNYE